MATPADSFLEEEPPRRHDVAMAVIDGKAYMWGGRDEWRNNMARYGASDIAVFDFETEHWEHRLTHGTQPLSAKGCAYASIGDVFYVCGGLLPGYYNNHNGLYALDTKTMVWTELTAADSSQGPRTASARMIPLGEDKLVILDNDHQLHVFDLTKRSWTKPKVRGAPPSATAWFSFTPIDERTALVFGGKDGENQWCDAVHMLNMNTWVWSKMAIDSAELTPRLGQSVVALPSADAPGNRRYHYIMVIGGYSAPSTMIIRVVPSAHKCVVEKVQDFKELEFVDYHSSATIALSPTEVKALSFGKWSGTIIMDIVKEDNASWSIKELVAIKDIGSWTRRQEQLSSRMNQKQDLLDECLRLISNKRSVTAKSSKIIVSGTPRSGKSSLIERLLGNCPSFVTTGSHKVSWRSFFHKSLNISSRMGHSFSTGVATKPRQVTIRKIQPHAVTVAQGEGKADSSCWKEKDERSFLLDKLNSLQLKPEIESSAKISLTGDSYSLHYDEASLQESSISVNSSVLDSLPSEVGIDTVTDSKPVLLGESPETPVSASLPFNKKLPLQYLTPKQILEQVFECQSIEELQGALDNSPFLQVIDTGGQLEFHELFPALVCSSAIHVVVFSLKDDLQKRFAVEYVSSTRTMKPYLSSVTTEDVIFQLLSSISSTSPNAISPLQKTTVSFLEFPSQALIVGTHMDCVTEKRFRAINEEFSAHLSHALKFDRSPLKCPEGSSIYPVSNLRESDIGISSLQDDITAMIFQNIPEYKLPVTWLFFSYSLKSCSKKVITIEQCARIGKACEIETDNELKLCLWYLQYQLGMVRFFPDVPELAHLVFIDTQVLFDCVTDLVTNGYQFIGTYYNAATARKLRETGRLPVSAVSSLSFISEIGADTLIAVLKHLRILSEIFDTKGEVSEYFIPFLLKSYEVESMEVILTDDAPAPLLVTFKCGYCPTGLFSALITELLLKWSLSEKPIYRNKVVFLVGNDFDEVTLINRPSFYEVQIKRSKQVRPTKPLSRVCELVCNSLLKALSSCKNRLRYTLAEYQVAFYATCKGTPHPVDVCKSSSVNAYCHVHGQPFALRNREKVWFGDELEESTVVADAPSNNPNSLAVQNKVLKMKNLLLLKSPKGKEVRIVMELAANWKAFGYHLDLDETGATLDIIEQKRRGDPESCCREMFSKWLQQNKEITWRTLICLLEDFGRQTLADIVKNILESM